MPLSFRILRLIGLAVFLISAVLFFTSSVDSGIPATIPVLDDSGIEIGSVDLRTDLQNHAFLTLSLMVVAGLLLVIVQLVGKQFTRLEKQVERLENELSYTQK